MSGTFGSKDMAELTVPVFLAMLSLLTLFAMPGRFVVSDEDGEEETTFATSRTNLKKNPRIRTFR
jgi:hypothetical protein